MSSWVRGKCIGRGSFGAVNVAVNKMNDDVFAVKSVDRNACHPTQIQSLENEIRILRSLSSPYVVKYLGEDVTYEAPNTSYRNLHMEYLPGGTVSDLATTTDAYVDEKVLRSHTYCIVSSLRYLHSSGIVHCDVKGKNILVSSSSGFPKLADFGSAGKISDMIGVKILPRGSPLWMAPEVVRGEYQGPESDVWSLGCTIIEMVTGKPAWEDFGTHTLTRIGLSNELPRFPTLLSELGHDFLEKCLRRKPSERWSCDQLLKHPFLQSASPNITITEPSPRCVLDWVNSEFQEDDIEVANFEASARARIGKLATSTIAIWESDGWLAVRCNEKEREAGGGGEGTRRDYSSLMSTEDETDWMSSVYSDSLWTISEIDVRVNSEIRNISDSELVFGTAYRRCGYGWQKVASAVKMKAMGIYHSRMCNFNLLLLFLCLCCMRIFRSILFLPYGICYILGLPSLYLCM